MAVSRSDRVLFSDLSVTVTDGDRLGVVGINGTGKSTLLRVLAGAQTPEQGELRRGRGVRIGFLDQEAVLPEGSVRQAVGSGWEADAILERLGMGLAADRDLSQLSGGQAKRVALARVLAHPVELLILDEPTNHLDLPAVAWLEGWLSRFRGGVVMVSHDRHLLDRVTTRMIELDRGRAHLHEGGYAGYLASRAERAGRAAQAEATRRNLARTELAWLRRGAPARTRKPQARVEAARRLVDARPEADARSGRLQLGFDAPRLGDKVIDLHDVAFSYGAGLPPVLSGVTLSLDRRDRTGVVGPNGSGKSTLLEILAGLRAPVSGRVERGPTVRLGYYAQHGPEFDPAARVRDLVAGPTRAPGDPADAQLMERFWFTGELPWATVGTLSGGERRRLQLLLVLAARPNVLLLDEPTNDLDLDTLRALEDFLEDWPGAVVAVSHDRVFLDRVTDRVLSCQHSTVAEVAGGLAAWIDAVSSPGSAQQLRTVGDRAPLGGVPGLSSATRVPRASGSELRKLEKEMARLGRERDRLSAAMQATTDHRRLATVGAELAELQAQLDGVEDRWLELAEQGDSPG